MNIIEECARETIWYDLIATETAENLEAHGILKPNLWIDEVSKRHVIAILGVLRSHGLLTEQALIAIKEAERDV